MKCFKNCSYFSPLPYSLWWRFYNIGSCIRKYKLSAFFWCIEDGTLVNIKGGCHGKKNVNKRKSNMKLWMRFSQNAVL